MPDALGPWRRWWRLPAAEKCIVVRLAWKLISVDLSLRFRGLKCTRRRLLQHLPDPAGHRCSAAELAAAQRLAALTALVGGRTLGQRSCLRQALVVEQWLRRSGLPAELRVGVRKASAQLDAHAWVELEGTALGQSLLQHQVINGVGQHL